MEKALKDEPLTISVPEAALRYFGIRSKAAAYAAARNGQIPVVRIGHLLRVPIRAMDRVLDTAGTKPKSRLMISK